MIIKKVFHYSGNGSCSTQSQWHRPLQWPVQFPPGEPGSLGCAHRYRWHARYGNNSVAGPLHTGSFTCTRNSWIQVVMIDNVDKYESGNKWMNFVSKEFSMCAYLIFAFLSHILNINLVHLYDIYKEYESGYSSNIFYLYLLMNTLRGKDKIWSDSQNP